jgi:hypothetical protein
MENQKALMVRIEMPGECMKWAEGRLLLFFPVLN